VISKNVGHLVGHKENNRVPASVWYLGRLWQVRRIAENSALKMREMHGEQMCLPFGTLKCTAGPAVRGDQERSWYENR
jgi:hypothetical protein